jgi:hypothetical protein
MQKNKGSTKVVPLSAYEMKVGRPDATITNLWILGSKTRLVAKYVISGTMPIIADVTNFIVKFKERPEIVESEPMNMCMPGKS